MNKLLQILLWILSVVAIILVLSFANKQKNYMQLATPIIEIDYNSENRFIDESDVLKEIIHQPNDSDNYVYKFYNLVFFI